MFADDCLIFAKATKKAARNIHKVLEVFSNASGQKINFHKSSLYFSEKVVSKKYLRKCSLFQAKKKQKNSFAWNGILDVRDINVKDQIRNTINTQEVVSDYFDADGWNITKLREHLNEDVVKEILGIPIPTHPSEDEFFGALHHMVWKARNDAIFKGKSPCPNSIVAAATFHQCSAIDSASTNRNTNGRMNESNMIRWSPPPTDWVKINFDGSVKSNSAAGGFILRTSSGQPIAVGAFNSGVTNVPVAEALALRNSLICAKERGLTKIEVEGDSKLIIDVVNGVSHPPWRLLKLYHDIKCLSCSFESIRFSHVFREANFVANALANMGHRSDRCGLWVENVPPEVSLALSFDCMNIGCSGVAT
ncbi:hypothetical protein ACLB2K_069562 [Fragaria x ananassa]